MNEIHTSFIKSLLLVAIVTLVSMATARIIVNKVISDRYKPSNFTLQKLPDQSDR
jgi:capsular polysaccharide biosynthesis protein